MLIINIKQNHLKKQFSYKLDTILICKISHNKWRTHAFSYTQYMPLEINKMTRGRNKACCTIGIGSSILARTFFGVRTRGCIVNLSEKLSVSM